MVYKMMKGEIAKKSTISMSMMAIRIFLVNVKSSGLKLYEFTGCF